MKYSLYTFTGSKTVYFIVDNVREVMSQMHSKADKCVFGHLEDDFELNAGDKFIAEADTLEELYLMALLEE